jgi:hypothetical protein
MEGGEAENPDLEWKAGRQELFRVDARYTYIYIYMYLYTLMHLHEYVYIYTWGLCSEPACFPTVGVELFVFLGTSKFGTNNGSIPPTLDSHHAWASYC